MDSFKQAVCSFSGTPQDLHREVVKFTKTVTTMSPRIALLIMMSSCVLEEYDKNRKGLTALQDKELLCTIIDEVKGKRQKSVQKLLSYSDGIIINGDTVLVHDVSHTVFDVLRRAHDRHVKFDTLVAAQEEKQTERMVGYLQEAKIPFVVAPEYLLVHVIEKVTKAFLGAVTINSFYEVIADAGSRAIVGQLRHHGIPVYVPITTDKLSLWTAQQKHHSFKTTHYKSIGGREYNKLIFSHDRYPVDHVTRFVTNKGCLIPEEMQNLYDKYFAEREAWRKKTCL